MFDNRSHGFAVESRTSPNGNSEGLQESTLPFSLVWRGGIGRAWWISRETPLNKSKKLKAESRKASQPLCFWLDSSRRERADRRTHPKGCARPCSPMRIEEPSLSCSGGEGWAFAAPKWLRPRRRGEEAVGSLATSPEVDAHAPRRAPGASQHRCWDVSSQFFTCSSARMRYPAAS